MVELITEILIYLGLAALLGLVLGYLIWGWGKAARISAARAEGAAGARTSIDGNAGLRDQLETCRADRARLENEVDRLNGLLQVSEAEVTRLEAALAKTETAGPPENSEPVEQPEQESADPDTVEPDQGHDDAPSADLAATEDGVDEQPDADDEADATAVTDEAAPPVPDGLLSERPVEVDDLKRIKGVGPVMEDVLNSKGIYLFRQVANLTPREVDWVNEAIDAFPGRIQRDRWVGQAQQLYREKYGRAHDESD